MDSKRVAEFLNRAAQGLKKGNFFKKDRILILLLGGILLLVISLPVSRQDGRQEEEYTQEETALHTQGEEEYAGYIERKLEQILSQVEGVGQTRVMVTIQASAEKVLEKDREEDAQNVTEEDSQGGTRSTVSSSVSAATVYDDQEGGSGGTPYVKKELSPVIEGVVVIAQGGTDPETVQNITGAIQALFPVDTHKIKVMKLNEN